MSSLSTELKNFFFYINTTPGADKITFGIGQGIHYTIRYWNIKKIIELHIKNEPLSTYETIIEIKCFTFLKLLINFSKAHEYLFRKYWLINTINLGKLKHHNFILYPISTNADDTKDIFVLKSKMLRFKKNLNFNELQKNYIFPDDLLHNEYEFFKVFKYKNGNLKSQGDLYKIKNRPNKKQFILITNKNRKNFDYRLLLIIYSLLLKLDFSKKEYVLKILYDKLPYKYKHNFNLS